MREIRIPCRSRVRRVPERFSWVDQRFVTGGHMRRLSGPSLGLYLFLVTVGNYQGISWYGDKRIQQETGLLQTDLESARRELIDRDLLAFEAPFYQILSLIVPRREVGNEREIASGRPATTAEVAAIIQESRRRIFGGNSAC